MKQEDIKRMNELYHLSQERALSEDEFAEWEELKKRYVADLRRISPRSSTIHI